MAEDIVVNPIRLVANASDYITNILPAPTLLDVWAVLSAPSPTFHASLGTTPVLDGQLNAPLPTLNATVFAWTEQVSVEVSAYRLISQSGSYIAQIGEPTIPFIFADFTVPLPTSGGRLNVPVEIRDGLVAPGFRFMSRAESPNGVRLEMNVALPTFHAELVKPPLDVHGIMWAPQLTTAGNLDMPEAVLLRAVSPLPTLSVSANLKNQIRVEASSPLPFFMTTAQFKSTANAVLVSPGFITSGYIWAVTEQDVSIVLNAPSPTFDGSARLDYNVMAAGIAPLPTLTGLINVDSTLVSAALQAPLPVFNGSISLKAEAMANFSIPLPLMNIEAKFSYDASTIMMAPLPELTGQLTRGGVAASVLMMAPLPTLDGSLLLTDGGGAGTTRQNHLLSLGIKIAMS